ncbi:hypothetical protein HZZ02_16640, partial [Streptococcus danieliae]|nr:hypothetical protein [Streptococcus danieliae]
MGLAALGLVATPLIGCASRTAAPAAASASARPRAPRTGVPPQPTQLASVDRSITSQSRQAITEMEPPPDIFDAQALDLEFWLKPRT